MERRSVTGGVALLAALMCLPDVWAQENSRAEEIQSERRKKASQLAPDQPNPIERKFQDFQDARWLERVTEGIHGLGLKVGGMAQGAGFAFGPQYRWPNDGSGDLTIRASALTSTRAYQKYDVDISLPHLANDRLFADLYTVHHNYPSLGYYGPGPDSEKSGRSDYRLEDTAIDGNFGVRPVRHLSLGSSVGYVMNNVGPGTDSRFASADAIYLPSQTPGIDYQANFLRFGAFAQYDYRDIPAGDARKGGNYFVQYSSYRDQTFGRYDFQRLESEAQQFVPVLNERRVFALRAKSILTMPDGGAEVPFYFQPSLGGSEDLRGYRPYRFRDNNLVAFNAEYRWQVFSGLDMAVFGDAGKVSHQVSQLNLHNLETDAGFGFRFNAKNQTFLRMDIGFSHEGFQVSVKFHNIFRQGPVFSSSSQREF